MTLKKRHISSTEIIEDIIKTKTRIKKEIKHNQISVKFDLPCVKKLNYNIDVN